MIAARKFKPANDSQDEEIVVRKIVEDSDQDDYRGERGESVMIVGGGRANRANRDSIVNNDSG